MKKSLILIFFVFTFLGCNKDGQKFNLIIRVIDNTNIPIYNIKVTLVANDGSSKVAYTDEDGEAGFDTNINYDDVNSIYFEKAIITDSDKDENGGFFSTKEITIDYKQELYIVSLEKMVAP